MDSSCSTDATRQRTDDETQHLIYESDQSFKFKALSAFGGVYATCWLGYVAADAFIIDPTGAIASNSGIVGFIGVSSVACGAFVVRTLAAKTVGRLVIDSAAPAAPTLRVTTYGPAGGERVDEAPLVDIIPRSAPSDTSRLKTFCLPDDETRAYLVLVDPGSVKDPRVALAESSPASRPPARATTGRSGGGGGGGSGGDKPTVVHVHLRRP